MARNNFKLLRVRVMANEIFEDIDVKFYDKADHPEEPYTTLIIGPNGTGKSFLLHIILSLFSELSDLRTSRTRNAKITGRFCLEYELNGNVYKYFNYYFPDDDKYEQYVKSNEVKPQITKNDVPIARTEIVLPQSVLALSNSIKDRFYTEINGFEEYTYLGVRVNSNTARTSSFINRTITLLYEMLPDKRVLANIERALDFLGYDKRFMVGYYPRYKHIFFKGDLTEKTFNDFFLRFWNYTKRTKENPPWSLQGYKKIKKTEPDLIPKLVKLCNKLSTILENEEGSRIQFFDIDVFHKKMSAKELSYLKTLHSLDIISYPGIGLYKKNQYLSIEDTSSGEYHFISSFIGLLAKIKNNSLVLIDEPENSLHPNWQMKYITFLKSIFENFKSCHFVIASHSHFMVSDLLSSSSTIVGLRKDDKIEADLIRANTYAWSAEEILLKIFKVSSSRNYYLTEQLEKVFALMGEEPTSINVKKLKAEVKELKKVDFSGMSDEDPLKDVVTTLLKKFEDA